MSQFQQRKSKKRRCRAWDSNTGRKVGTCSLSYGGYHQCCSYLNVLSNLSLGTRICLVQLVFVFLLNMELVASLGLILCFTTKTLVILFHQENPTILSF